MKRKSTHLALSILFSFICWSSLVVAQDISIETTNYCSPTERGSITLAVEGNFYTPPFYFRWSNPLDPPGVFFEEESGGVSTFDNLNPGNYCVTVTSADGCFAESCDLVVETELVIESLTPICVCEWGSADIEVSGGSGDYSYIWAGPTYFSEEETPIIIPPPFGGWNPATYTVTVTDNETGCQVTESMELDLCNSTDLIPFMEVTPSCSGAGTGAFSLEIPEDLGAPPYYVFWTHIGGSVEEYTIIDENFSLDNLQAGEYCIEVLSENGCSTGQVCGIVIEEVEELEPTVNIFLLGAGNSVVQIQGAVGGPSIYQYYFTWFNEDNEIVAEGVGINEQFGLPEGGYTVTIQNDEGHGDCEYIVEANLLYCDNLVAAFSGLEIEADVTPMMIVDGQEVGGAIDILNVSDAYPDYNFHYNWGTNVPLPYTYMEDISGLSEGHYCLYVNLPSVCGDDGNPPLKCWDICSFKIDLQNEPENCQSTNLTALVDPPSSSYTYEWRLDDNPDGQVISTEPTISAVYGNEYCLTIRDNNNNGCEGTLCTVAESEPITLAADVTNATFGNADGEVSLTVQGGNPAYAYSWQYNGENHPATTSTISGYPGIYTVTVTDGCGNTATLAAEVECEFGTQDFVADISEVSCKLGTYGAIRISQFPDDAVGPFEIVWDNGMQGPHITGLPGGDYCATVTDESSECFSVLCYTVPVNGHAGLNIDFDIVPVSCSGNNAGEITAIPNISSYSYEWTNFSQAGNFPAGNTAHITNRPAGWHGVVISDSRGCSSSKNAFIGKEKPFSISLSASPNPAYPNETVELVVSSTSGAPEEPVNYEWTHNFDPGTIVNTSEPFLATVEKGHWRVTATDATGCSASAYVIVKKKCSGMQIQTKRDGYCEGDNATLEVVSVANGSAPFTYTWSNGSTSHKIENLEEGVYTVTVTDENGCTAEQSYSVGTDPVPFYATSTVLDDACIIDFTCIGSININGVQFLDPISGGVSFNSGTLPYQYNWSNGATGGNLGGLCPGDYGLTVTTATGCSAEVPSISIDEYGLNCGIRSESSWHNDRHIALPGFSVSVYEISCFDDDCSDECSKFEVHAGNTDYCWTGDIILTLENYYDDPPETFTVELEVTGISTPPTTNSVAIVSGDDTWYPPQAGTYDVTVEYYGQGNSAGNDCVIKFPVDWFGAGNQNEVVGFNGDFWFNGDDMGVPDIFMDSYFGAWKCHDCAPEYTYILNNDQGKCNGFDNWEFTFFDFRPDNYNDPCSSGWITVMDFNGSSTPTVHEKYLSASPDLVIDERPGQPFSNVGNLDLWCSQSGWCLFEQDKVYSTAGLNKPILATWSNPDECDEIEWYDPEDPTSESCVETGYCPDGLVCNSADGNCYLPCEEGECINGECVEGFCVEVETDGCPTPCPSDMQCQDGECHLNDPVCGFYRDVNGQGGYNAYYLWHDLDPNTTVSFTCKTYHIEDKFTIYEGSIHPTNELMKQNCISTFNDDVPDSDWSTPIDFQVGTEQTIIVVAESCESESSKFILELSCGEMVNEQQELGDHVSYRVIGTGPDEVFIDPNPFVSEIKIKAMFDERFDGVVRLFDNLGNKVFEGDYSFDDGYTEVVIDGLENLPPSLYTLTITREGELLKQEKLIKAN